MKLFAIAPPSHPAVLVEFNDAHFGTIAEIKRDERFAHVQIVNPHLAFTADANVVRPAVKRDDLIPGHADFGILFVVLRSGFQIGRASCRERV